jgi:hypothetical protein
MPPAARRSIAPSLLLVLAAASVAHAGNDDEILNGPEAAMTGGAVTAVTAETASLIYNPAGVAGIEHSRVEASASAFALRYYSAALIRNAAGDRANGTFLEIVSAPSALGFVTPLGGDFYLGLGAFVTRASNVNINAYLSEDVGTAANPSLEAKWLLTIADQTTLYHFGGALGFRAAPNLRLGVGLLGLYAGTFGSYQLAGGLREADTEAVGNFVVAAGRLAADYFGLRANAGVQYEPTPNLVLGLSVMSPGFILLSSGELASAEAGTDFSTVALFDASRDKETRFGFDALEPLRVRAGAALKWDGHWVALDADIQPGISDKTLDTEREFVWNARLGGKFHVAEEFWVGGGLFTDLASDPKVRGLGEASLDYVGGTLGAAWSNARKLDPSEGNADIAFSTTLSLRYAYGFGKVGGLLTNSSMLVDDTYPVDATAHEFALYFGSGLHY